MLSETVLQTVVSYTGAFPWAMRQRFAVGLEFSVVFSETESGNSDYERIEKAAAVSFFEAWTDPVAISGRSKLHRYPLRRLKC